MGGTKSGASSSRQLTKLVCFYLGSQEYGAAIAEVKETMLLRPITGVFLTPRWLTGIINLRGDVVALIDLAQLLGQPPTVLSDDSRIVIVQHDESDRNTNTTITAGVLVDRMAALRSLDLETLAPPPTTLAAASASLLSGVATVEDNKPLRVLDFAALFESEGIRAFQRRT